MVGIVIVSHSAALAEGVVALARELDADGELAIAPAGGTSEPGVLGTDAQRVHAAIESVMSADGVLVLTDLGSALMSAELAVEMLAGGHAVLSDAPLVEGAGAAAAAAAGGASLDEVAAQARGAMAMKQSHLDRGDGRGEPVSGSPAPPSTEAELTAELTVSGPAGLHARPAARVVARLRGLDADVRVAGPGSDAFVSARSLTSVLSLGVRQGQTVRVRACGPDAPAAIDALRALAAAGFGDTLPDAPAPPGATDPPDAPSPSPPTAVATLCGSAVSAGITLGPARHPGIPDMIDPPAPATPGSPETERQRLDDALRAARQAIEHDRATLAGRVSGGEAEILDAHLALLDDEALIDPAAAAIAAGSDAARAWYDAVTAVVGRYRGMHRGLLRERAADVVDVGRRVLGALSGQPPRIALKPGVLIARELAPAEAAALDSAVVTGIATARGSAGAHAAILARALGIPAVMGLGEAILTVAEDTTVLLDGGQGTVLVDPAPQVARDGQRRERERRARHAAARRRAREPGQTRDGTRVRIHANLGDPAQTADAVALGAEGVGLLRTEFLYLDRPELPGEDEQVQTLRAIAATLEGRPLVLRTLDAGADKPLPALAVEPEANPYLGVRGVRLALARPAVLLTQLRAALRVAAEFPGAIAAMVPMVSVADEVRAVRALLDRARGELGIDAPLALGIMVEVPAAALEARALAAHVDFFSIGTNDLTQYTMAAERGNAQVAHLLTGLQPSVLELVRRTLDGARALGRPVAVCGELAGDPATAVALVRAGIRELSMSAALIPEVKAALRELELD